MSHQHSTICAIATPPGIGGIAVIRVSGTEAIDICNNLFSKDLTALSPRTAVYGSFGSESVVDDVVVTLFKSPASFTGEDVVEIACHGSLYIQQEIVKLLIDHGAALAGPGDFTKRAFLNGKMDLSQAEAVADLISSENQAMHRMAMNQMRGGFSNDLKQLRQKLVDFASLIELELDFSEEDVEFADRTHLESLVNEIIAYVGKLVDSFSTGNAIKNGIQTVIAGRPNAGKSTLLNGLLNEERAIVSDIPGTTRDTIEELTHINGMAFRLIDTAGIRAASDTIEQLGIKRTMEKINQSSLFVYVYDVNETSAETVKADLAEIGAEVPTLVLANKVDISKTQAPTSDALPISAIDKQDIETVKAELYKLGVNEEVNLNQTIVSNARHYEALSHALSDLNQVQEGLKSLISGDFLAMDIRSALRHLGSITGDITTDELLGNIFGRFCIGK